MSAKSTKLLISKVEKILWENWDPIGVRAIDDFWPDDEYNSYAPSIAKLLLERTDEYKIATKLNQYAELNMGLIPAREHDGQIAKLLLNLTEE